MSSFFTRAKQFDTREFLVGRVTRVIGAGASGYALGRWSTTRAAKAGPLVGGVLLTVAALWLEMNNKSPKLAEVLSGLGDGGLTTAVTQAAASVGFVHAGQHPAIVDTKTAHAIKGHEERAILGAVARSTAAGRPAYLTARGVRAFARHRR
ncbi:MAG TPA: hypothetical protein VGL86_02035 [Polyangia bacterium]|jgi:hypothetical protein